MLTQGRVEVSAHEGNQSCVLVYEMEEAINKLEHEYWVLTVNNLSNCSSSPIRHIECFSLEC